MSEEILRVEDLVVRFYTYAGVVKAIEGVSFTVFKGECFGLVGETGCGKSVTMRSIMRLIPPPGRIVSGKIFFEGKNLLELSEEEMREIRGRKISYIVQEPMTALDPIFKIGYQVAEPVFHHKLANSFKEAIKHAIKALREARMPSPERTANMYPHELSGGMRQRAVISTSLACEPDLIIADEPTTAVDVTIQAQIMDLLRNLQKSRGLTMILVTHNLGLVAEMCDRVAVMYAGNIVEIADVFTLFGKPMHPYTNGLLKAVPHIAKRKHELKLEPIPGTIPNLIYPPPGCRFHPRCPYAKDICKKEKPELVEVESGHFVACHLYHRR